PPPAPLVDAAMMEADAQSLASVARGAANPPQAADALHRIEGDAAIGLPAVESAAANGAPITEAARGEMQGQAERVLDLVRDHTADAPAAVPEPDTRPQLVEAQPQEHEGNSVSASLTELQRLADQLTKAGAVIEDETGKHSAGDLLNAAVQRMRDAAPEQAILDNAAKCIMGVISAE